MALDFRSILSRFRVPAGFLLAGLYFSFSQPTLQRFWAGGAVAFLGILIRGWATGHIRKNDELAVTGPYAYTRNPLYFGTFLIGLGFCLAGSSTYIWILFLTGFAMLYGSVMQQEMDYLKTKFADEYARYQAAVPLFFPSLCPCRLGQGRFSFRRYLQNKEYQALLGFVMALGLLLFKIRTS
jgi:protein-S-isoprenylcysteine O-methyltransferase Ste14